MSGSGAENESICSMTSTEILLQRNLLSIFSQRSRQKRLKALSELWERDGILSAEDGTSVGYEAIDKAAGALLRKYPEFDFSALGGTDEIPGAARLRWRFGAKGEPPAVTGEHVALITGGRIVALYKFLDGVAL
jgi:hypothetical protein